MRLLLFSILSIIIFSCSRDEKKEVIQQFILFGHAGYKIIDEEKWIIDSSQFNIRHYFEYNKNYISKIANTERWGDTLHYFKVGGEDTIGLQNFLSSALMKKEFNDQYFFEQPSMYDGPYYYMYFKTSYGRQRTIQFVPSELPDDLKSIFNLIDNMLSKKDLMKIEKFKFPPIIKYEALKNFRTSPHTPPPETVIEGKNE